MRIKLKKNDWIFIVAIFVCSLLHFLCMFTPLPYNDEVLYPTVALRFINGDNMIQHEWHLSQFSSLFSYFPVLIWLKIKGSTEGIIFFIRLLYLVVHTLTAFIIYRTFRRYKIWAVGAAILFYSQVAYRMFTIGYMSMGTVFLTLFSIALFSIYEKRTTRFYVYVGICFALCCVCNPLYCVLYVVYIIVCIMWKRRMYKMHNEYNNASSKRKKEPGGQIQKFTELYDDFFNKKVVFLLSGGIGIVAVICIFYFFITGGTFELFVKNIGNLFAATEYGVFSALVSKLRETILWFNEISLGLPFLLPAMYIVLLFDVDRNKHRITYLVSSVAIMLVYVCGIAKVFLSGVENAFALSLPYIFFSSVCYILTNNKNKALFYCMWCPSLIGATIQYLASNTLLTSFFAIFVIAHIPGTFFVRDLVLEICDAEKQKNKHSRNKKHKNVTTLCCIIIFTAFCSQLIFNGYLYAYNRIPTGEKYTKVTYGPLSSFYLDDDYHESYVNSLNDLDIIRFRSEKNDPVLITSRLGWMHLYLDRPFAAYTVCLLNIEPALLDLYYEQNPDKIPRYIYVGFADTYYIADRSSALEKVNILKEIFDCTTEELSMGFLLTVNGLF